MKPTVVLLFNDLRARNEALHYAAELSARMQATLVLLLLLPLEAVGSIATDGRELEQVVRGALSAHVQAARGAGVPVEVVLRVGDPSSELMKYLAITRTIHTIVWGGEQAVLDRRVREEQQHWLVRIRDRVDLPVVVPSHKAQEGGTQCR